MPQTLSLEELLSKRRELLVLRNKLTSQGQIEVETTGLMETLKKMNPNHTIEQDEKNSSEGIVSSLPIMIIHYIFY